MGAIKGRVVFAVCILALMAGSVAAFVHERESDSPLQAKEFIASALDVTPINARAAGSFVSELETLGANQDVAFLDSRGGRWRTLLFSLPMIPGSGVGNNLTWEDGRPATDEDLGELAWKRVREFVANNAATLRIDVNELEQRVTVHDGGNLIQIWADRKIAGLPVRGSGLTAVINSGNLVLMGAEQWGDVELDLTPLTSAESARAEVESFVAPLFVSGLREDSALVILPIADEDGYGHRLAWAVRPSVVDDMGQWEALVDAHNGELLALQDLNHYGTARTIVGGVYPMSYDDSVPGGVMVDGYPMPYANLSSGGFTDAGGNFEATGNVTTNLNGQYIRIQEFCGPIDESSEGDIDLEGDDNDTNCDVPPGHSDGDTAAARSGFYELNRMNAQARAQLGPGNAWVNGQLTAQMNISPTCNAFWTGTVVQFFREQGICANTGQIAGVFDHEWGHGMDDNDANGFIPGLGQGGGEGMADIYAALRLNEACVGRGFFLNGMTCGGYGDPCTAASGCTGVRSIDFADRTSGAPHTLTWVRANCSSPHCLGAAYSETVWDIAKRDLPAMHGMDNNTALEVTTRLTYIGAGNASGWFDRTGPPPGGAGCGAGQGYLQYLAADDDNGNVGDGTPHMDAIAAAFDRHEIGCTPGNGGPTVTVSGCAGTPTEAPTLTAAPADMGADLSWNAIGGASSYNVYRTDGEWACDFGKELVGNTTGTTFSDSELLNERNYYWVVIPMGSDATCFGPASNCANAIPGGPPPNPLIFMDGFESGDTSAWTNTNP